MAVILQKWNNRKHRYEKFISPADYPRQYSMDMKKEVECAECGKMLPFGETYTSRFIHDEVGFGYAICGNCYDKELNEPS